MAEPLRILRRQAEGGDLEAQCHLADLHLERETDEGNRAAIPWLRKAVAQGYREVVRKLAEVGV